jgi:hypothetical protein
MVSKSQKSMVTSYFDDLDITVTNMVAEATILVTGRGSATAKVLEALVTPIPIVDFSWVQSLVLENIVKSTESHRPDFAKTAPELSNADLVVRSRRILENFQVYVIESCNQDYRRIMEKCGARVVIFSEIDLPESHTIVNTTSSNTIIFLESGSHVGTVKNIFGTPGRSFLTIQDLTVAIFCVSFPLLLSWDDVSNMAQESMDTQGISNSTQFTASSQLVYNPSKHNKVAALDSKEAPPSSVGLSEHLAQHNSISPKGQRKVEDHVEPKYQLHNQKADQDQGTDSPEVDANLHQSSSNKNQNEMPNTTNSSMVSAVQDASRRSVANLDTSKKKEWTVTDTISLNPISRSVSEHGNDFRVDHDWVVIDRKPKKNAEMEAERLLSDNTENGAVLPEEALSECRVLCSLLSESSSPNPVPRGHPNDKRKFRKNLVRITARSALLTRDDMMQVFPRETEREIQLRLQGQEESARQKNSDALFDEEAGICSKRIRQR